MKSFSIDWLLEFFLLNILDFSYVSALSAFCSAHRTLMRFRADILRSKTDALKRSVISYFITTA